MVALQTSVSYKNIDTFAFGSVSYKNIVALTARYFCGPEEIRTPDPLIANEVLYQLSYRPAGDLYHRSYNSGTL